MPRPMRDLRFTCRRPGARSDRSLWARRLAAKTSPEALCLVTGERAPIARIHPAIKGIRARGASQDADSIVAFNRKAFESYGHEQGDNAQVSERSAFAY